MSMTMRMTLLILMAVLLLNEEHVNDYNKHNDDHEGHLVDTDGLVFVGEVAGEQVQGGSGRVNLHCALETILVRTCIWIKAHIVKIHISKCIQFKDYELYSSGAVEESICNVH